MARTPSRIMAAPCPFYLLLSSMGHQSGSPPTLTRGLIVPGLVTFWIMVATLTKGAFPGNPLWTLQVLLMRSFHTFPYATGGSAASSQASQAPFVLCLEESSQTFSMFVYTYLPLCISILHSACSFYFSSAVQCSSLQHSKTECALFF